MDFEFISSAFAQEAASASSPSSLLTGMLPLILIMVVFYFLLIRPQQKKMKQHQNMVRNLKKGDKVIIVGGIFGTISKLEEGAEVILVEIADNVKIRVRRDSILEILSAQTSPTPIK